MKRKLILFLSLLFFNNINYGQPTCDTLIFDSHGYRVAGYFYSSDYPNSPSLIFTQGFMETGDLWGIGKSLSAKGINVFMFDFRGCFQSEGKQGLMNSQEDIGAALDFLTSDPMAETYLIDTSNIIIGGYSYGGHMSLLYAIHHPEVRKVLSISGGDLGIFGELIQASPDLRKGYTNFFQSIKKPNGPVEFQYNDPIQELVDHQDYFYILEQSQKLSNVDILIVGGLDDSVVSLEDYMLPLYRKLKQNTGQKVKFKVYQTGHSYQNVTLDLLEDIELWIIN